MSEFESAVLNSREKLRATEDKVNERFQKIKIHGYNSSERIRINYIECDSDLFKLISDSEKSIEDLEIQLRSMKKKKKAI